MTDRGAAPEQQPATTGSDVSQLHTRLAELERELENRDSVETTLRRSEALHRAVVETAYSGIVTMDHNGVIIAFNRAAEHMFGYPASSAIGRSVSILMPDRLRAEYEACLHRLLNDDESSNVGHTHEFVAQRCDDLEFPIELTVSRVQEGGETLYTGIIRDITERKRIETERAALLASATEYARRLSELAVLKADFSAMVAHEMSAPLAAIRSMTDLLARRSTTPEDRIHLLSTIQAEVGLLTRLVADVQSVASLERDDFAVQPQAVPVGVLLGDAAAHARALPGNHPIFTHIKSGDMVMADPQRIGQVLRNLLNNAARYSSSTTPIELSATRNGPLVRITVTDHGYGIHPDDLEHIFAKFGRGRDSGGLRPHGFGLGLYLSRRIVQAHGSEFFVASTPGEGSSFGFDLEVAE